MTRYLVTSRKAITLGGVTLNPGDFVEDPENAGQLVRRGLAVPLGGNEEQAEARSPSPEPAPSSSKAEVEEETAPEPKAKANATSAPKKVAPSDLRSSGKKAG